MTKSKAKSPKEVVVAEDGKAAVNRPAEGKTIKKRPWRDKIRKKAKKDAAKVDREKKAAEAPPVAAAVDDSGKKKKKKRKKKKNFTEDEKKAYEAKKAKKRGDSSATVTAVPEEEPKSFVEESMKKLEAGRFRFLNEQLYTMSGADAWKFFQEDPEAFQCYHKGFAEQVKKWPNHPLSVISRWLQGMDDGQVVLDLGCGEAKISENIGEQHTVHSFDLVAVNDRVTACDMGKLPIGDEEADVAIFCLSLMGTNLVDYIKEARRTLRLGGILKIAEVTSRFVNVRLFCDAVCKLGFECKEKKNLTDYFVMFEFNKIEKVENKRPFGLKLKPCLYKKR